MRKWFSDLLKLIEQEGYYYYGCYYVRNYMILDAHIAPSIYMTAIFDIINKDNKTGPIDITKEEYEALGEVFKIIKERKLELIKNYENLD